MLCYWYEAPILFKAPVFLLYAPDLPPLLYYSHIPVTILALVVGLFVLFNAPKQILNRVLFAITAIFAIRTLVSLMSWTIVSSETIMFIWPLFGVLDATMFILSIYLVYVFLNRGHDISAKTKSILLLLLAPVFLLGHTNLSVSGFDLALCDAFGYEGFYYKLYYSVLGYLAIVWTSILFVKEYKKAEGEFKKQIVYMAIGIESFLILFSTIVPFVTYLAGLGVLENSSLEFYALFGMGIFMTMIGFIIVRFKAFNIGIIAANALVVALLLLVGSQYTYVEGTTAITLTSITLVLTALVGWVLVKSVRHEVEQRKEIEELATKLKGANERLKILDRMKSEFVSIASHQLRSPLTSIRGYASMLAEGTYGKIPVKVEKVLRNIEDSSRFMAQSVEDYLNVSRIEAGNMKYEYSDFNLKEQAERIVDEMRQMAMKKGLAMVFRSDIDGDATIHADIGKVRQVITNLIDNSMKYTPKGTITVLAHDDLKKKIVTVTIQDTGIGMDEDTIGEVFEKFIRAKNANSVNVTGTGLGLFVAKKMVDEMGGKVWAESEGPDKGSTFHLQFKIATAKTK